jgi:hypothetical protein
LEWRPGPVCPVPGRSRSSKLLGAIETGPMLTGDLLDYKITRAGLESKIKPFTYHAARFYIPRNGVPGSAGQPIGASGS